MNSSAGVGIEHCEVIFFPVKELTTDSKKLPCDVSRSDITQWTLCLGDLLERNGDIKYFA